MNAPLYIVRCQIEGDEIMDPVVGEDELAVHIRMAQHLGARVTLVSEAESELRLLVRNCQLEGAIKGWWLLAQR